MSATKISVAMAVMRTALRFAGGAVAFDLAFVVAAPALPAAHVGRFRIRSWVWRTILAPLERKACVCARAPRLRDIAVRG